jgi:hypothetical protein
MENRNDAFFKASLNSLNCAAEGEAVATSKLFEMVKKGAPWAVCIYLKARCGWREMTDREAAVNVNINDGLEPRPDRLPSSRAR